MKHVEKYLTAKGFASDRHIFLRFSASFLSLLPFYLLFPNLLFFICFFHFLIIVGIDKPRPRTWLLLNSQLSFCVSTYLLLTIYNKAIYVLAKNFGYDLGYYVNVSQIMKKWSRVWSFPLAKFVYRFPKHPPNPKEKKKARKFYSQDHRRYRRSHNTGSKWCRQIATP